MIGQKSRLFTLEEVFTPQNEEDWEAANLVADILIAAYEKGQIQIAINDIIKMGYEEYFQDARKIIEFERMKSIKLSVGLEKSIRSCGVNSNAVISNLKKTKTIPNEWSDYGNSVGFRFKQHWEDLGKLYIELIKTAERNKEVLEILDFNLKKNKPAEMTTPKPN